MKIIDSPDTKSDRYARLYGELLRIRDLLARQQEVHQLLVFGSMASGAIHAWSDLDLAVIADSDLPFLRRSISYAQRIQPHVGTQFLVYTPAEIQALRQRPFVKVEILEKGKSMPLNPRGEALRWLEFAHEDIRMAELAFDQEIFNQVCFHSQQSVEKALKACLAAAEGLVPRSHLLVDLFQELPAELQKEFAALELYLATLDQFYIPTRYPDALPGSLPAGLPDEEVAEQALAKARECYGTARRIVG